MKLTLPTLAVLAVIVASVGAYLFSTATEDEDLTFPFLLIITLVLAVGFSPRIPLDFGILGQRRFDIRIEDFVLVVVTLALLVDVRDRGLELPRYFVPLLGYFTLGGLVTLVGVVTTDLSIFRGIFYLLKEIEYGLIALAVANLVRNRRQLYVFTVVFVGCALLNAGWAGYQLVIDSTGPLFRTVEQSGYYGQPLGVSGTALIGEPSRLSSGGFYLSPLFLVFGWYLSDRDIARTRVWGVIGLAITFAIVGSLSRASIFSAVIAILFLIVFTDRIPNRWMVTGPSVGLLVSVAIAPILPVDRFRPTYVLRSIITRLGKWDPILSSINTAMLLGTGKGSLPVVAGVEEAHNFYLRIFIETGPIGLLLFVATLAFVVVDGFKTYERSVDPVVSAVAIAGVCATISIAAAALVQDAFINVKLAESYWLVVGAVGAAIRLSR